MLSLSTSTQLVINSTIFPIILKNYMLLYKVRKKVSGRFLLGTNEALHSNVHVAGVMASITFENKCSKFVTCVIQALM